MVFLAQTASAQTYTEENKTLERKQWTPEFTARYEMGLFTAGVAGTVGVRIDDKRTLGIIGWKGYSHMDAVRPVYEPGEFYPYLVWQPGFRIRFWKNIHIFTGLTVSYSNLGLHLGIGF